MDSWGSGFFISVCFKHFVDLFSLLILFYFSLKVLHLSILDLGFLNRFVNWFLNSSNPPITEKLKPVQEPTDCRETRSCFDENNSDEKQEQSDEDEVFDVMSLRKLVKNERQRANDAYKELEKERMAGTTAAQEAMGMILRLQNQKSVLELELQQQRRLSHEKQLHDQEVIQSLRWIVMKHETERSLLEDRLRLCKQRLMLYMNSDHIVGDHDIDGCELSLSYLDERLVSSLDLGMSPW